MLCSTCYGVQSPSLSYLTPNELLKVLLFKVLLLKVLLLKVLLKVFELPSKGHDIELSCNALGSRGLPLTKIC